tara:strand:- start:74 stop:409 length:336 start_codon:yes stop_codon:yes gene_type:complete
MTKNVYRISNNAYETNKKQNIIDAWKISLKYSKILMDHSNNDDYFDIVYGIHHEYLSELQREGLNFKNKNYMQVWDTMINTQKRNPKRDIKAGAIKLLHQTNVQRCDRFNR